MRADYSTGAKKLTTGAVMPCAVMRYDVAAKLTRVPSPRFDKFFADREVNCWHITEEFYDVANVLCLRTAARRSH